MGNKIYHYTNYDSFIKILKNGTLRFNRSTSSNDCLDTILIYNILDRIANEGLDNPRGTEALKFFYELVKYRGFFNNRKYMVSCFTSKKDSRLLWDSYTMNRRCKNYTRYNGVCIEFDEYELKNALSCINNDYVYTTVEPILYGEACIYRFLNDCIKDYLFEYYELKDNIDQHQSIVGPICFKNENGEMDEIVLPKSIVKPAKKLVNRIENQAPLFKHEFWKEERETRAVISVNLLYESEITDLKEKDNFFLSIDNKCISKIIFGPETTENEIDYLKQFNKSIDLSQLELERSKGTNVIRSTN